MSEVRFGRPHLFVHAAGVVEDDDDVDRLLHEAPLLALRCAGVAGDAAATARVGAAGDHDAACPLPRPRAAKETPPLPLVFPPLPPLPTALPAGPDEALHAAVARTARTETVSSAKVDHGVPHHVQAP